jgi:Spy/CpxP family protein refolding chaperone
MSLPEAPVRQRPSLLLIVSLCLNLALIGVVGVMLWRAHGREIGPHESRVGLSAQMLTRMVPAEASKIEGIVAEHRPRLHQLRGDAMRARAESFRLLTEPKFDSAAFAKSLAAVQAADAALETETMKLTADSVAALTPEERALVASKVQKPDRVWLRRFFGRR